MKRIMILCMMMVFMVSGFVNAEIKKEKDDMGLIVSSTIKEKQLDIVFSKSLIEKDEFYRIYVTTKTDFPEWLMADKPIEITIDRYPAFYLSDYHYKNIGDHYAHIDAVVPSEIVKRISKAKVIYLSCDDRSGSMGYSALLSGSLFEWKQVINTTE